MRRIPTQADLDAIAKTLREHPEVSDVEVAVHICVLTTVKTRDSRTAVYEAEQKLIQEHPDFLFDLHCKATYGEDA